MSESRLHQALRGICQDLSQSGASFALVGGLAVSTRTEPRFTKDVDLVVAVKSDREAEVLVASLRVRGYRIHALVEQASAGRLATVRLVPLGESSLFVDLLFASTGIEPEIVKAAGLVEVIPGLRLAVATLPHLIAAKVLSRDDARRPQDRVDLVALLAAASAAELEAAREALRTIHARGFHRGKDLLGELESFVKSLAP